MGNAINSHDLATLRAKDRGGALPLHIAAENGAPVEVVRELLAAHPDAAKTKSAYGKVPLHLGDEFQTFADQCKYALQSVRASMKTLLRLPIGGTAVRR